MEKPTLENIWYVAWILVALLLAAALLFLTTSEYADNVGLYILGLLFTSIFAIAALIFWIWMLVDCATKEPSEGNDKIVWILIILLTNLLGAIIYFVARRPKRLYESGYRSTPTMKGPPVRVLKATTLVLSLLVGGIFIATHQPESYQETLSRRSVKIWIPIQARYYNSYSNIWAENSRLKGNAVPKRFLFTDHNMDLVAPLHGGYCARTRVYGGGYAYFWCHPDEEIMYGLNQAALRLLQERPMGGSSSGIKEDSHDILIGRRGVNVKSAAKAIVKKAKKENLEKGSY